MLSDIRPGRAFLATAKISCRFAEEEMRLNPSRLPHLLLGEDERREEEEGNQYYGKGIASRNEPLASP